MRMSLGLAPFRDPVRVGGGPAEHLHEVGSVGEQTAVTHELPALVHGRNAMLHREANNPAPLAQDEGIRRRPYSSHPFGELAFLDEAPACALRCATVVARAGNAEDVADHHVVMPRNVLPQLAQEVVLLDAAWPHERADEVPVRTVQRHHRPVPTEADDMAVLAQLEKIDQLHRTLADLQCLIHVERVHGHRGFLQLYGADALGVSGLCRGTVCKTMKAVTCGVLSG